MTRPVIFVPEPFPASRPQACGHDGRSGRARQRRQGRRPDAQCHRGPGHRPRPGDGPDEGDRDGGRVGAARGTLCPSRDHFAALRSRREDPRHPRRGGLCRHGRGDLAGQHGARTPGRHAGAARRPGQRPAGRLAPRSTSFPSNHPHPATRSSPTRASSPRPTYRPSPRKPSTARPPGSWRISSTSSMAEPYSTWSSCPCVPAESVRIHGFTGNACARTPREDRAEVVRTAAIQSALSPPHGSRKNGLGLP